jgi:shikimate kinase
VLIGFMGAGKSTVAPLLAEQLDAPYWDLDAEVERRTGQSVAALFADRGEAFFRGVERDTLADLLARGPAVGALGGGAVLTPTVPPLLKHAGARIVWLQVDWETVMARIRPEDRPLLARDPASGNTLLRKREPAYRALAHVTVDARQSAEAVALQVAEWLVAHGDVA